MVADGVNMLTMGQLEWIIARLRAYAPSAARAGPASLGAV